MKGARLISALAVCALTAGAGFLVWSVPESDASAIPAQVSSAAPADIRLVCSGGFEANAQSGIDVESVDADMKSRSWLVGTSGSESVTDAQGNALSSDSAILQGDAGALTGVYSVPGETEDLQLAGGTLHTATAGDARGAAVNPCLSAQSDMWLVGSQASVGTSNVLVVTNPGENAVVVDLEAYGSTGLMDLGSLSQIAVAAGATVRTSLDGALESDSRIAVHVTSEGSVTAVLQETVLDGARPSGVTFVTPSQQSTSVTVPAVTVGEEATEVPTLRIVNTQPEAAEVSISVTDGSGTSPLPGGTNVPIAAQTVLDLSLSGLTAGQYTVHITSQAAVTAGVELVSQEAEGEPRDIAWAAAESSVTAGAAVFGPLGALVTVTAPEGTESSVTVTPIDSDGSAGEAFHAKLDAGGHVTFEMPEGTIAVTLKATAPVYAAVVTQANVRAGKTIDWVPIFSPLREDASRAIAVSD